VFGRRRDWWPFPELRWGLGEGGPGCGRARRLRLMVDSDLWGGGRGAIWRRRRALVPFCRGVVTVEVRPERKPDGGRSPLTRGNVRTHRCAWDGMCAPESLCENACPCVYERVSINVWKGGGVYEIMRYLHLGATYKNKLYNSDILSGTLKNVLRVISLFFEGKKGRGRRERIPSRLHTQCRARCGGSISQL